MTSWLGVPRTDVLLFVQRALWEIPTADLRGVSVGVRERAISADFHYDGPISDQHRELVSEAETQLIADMPPEVSVHFQAVSTPRPEPLSLDELSDWVFLRWEPTSA